MDGGAGFIRIVFNIFFDFPLVAFVSENLIVRFLLPKSASSLCELIDASGCIGFP